MTQGPLVSVVMPLYNGEQFAPETIDSILEQSLSSIELIIINDGSTDASREVVLSYDDPRILYHEFERNQGMAHARNKGIELANAAVVAMTDQDDISHSKRLETQYQFLHDNPSTMLVGTWVRHFGKTQGVMPYCADSSLIKIRMLGNSQFCHPSIAFRRSLVDELGPLYRQKFAPADDFQMLCAVCAHHDVGNIPLELLHYRIHAEQESIRKAQNLMRRADEVRADYVQQFLEVRLTDEELDLHLEAILPRQLHDRASFEEHVRWFEHLKDVAPGHVDKGVLGRYFSERLIATVINNTHLFGFGALATPYTVPFRRSRKHKEIFQILKALGKSYMRKLRFDT